MEINLKDNIFYKSYSKKIELNEEILNLIWDSKIDKVLFKGNPLDINYKLLKKIIPMQESIIEPEKVRSKFQNILELTDEPYCMIYKKD